MYVSKAVRRTRSDKSVRCRLFEAFAVAGTMLGSSRDPGAKRPCHRKLRDVRIWMADAMLLHSWKNGSQGHANPRTFNSQHREGD